LRKVTPNYANHYIVASSVGVAAQPSSIAVIEQESYEKGLSGSIVSELRLRYLERMPLDASYPSLAKRLRSICRNLEDKDDTGTPSLIVDVTGTGSSVIQFFHDENLKPIQAWITAGFGQSEVEPQKWRISKTELIGPLQVLLHTEKFRMAAELELADQFKTELANYRPKAVAVNGDDLEAWRLGQSDDLVFAVALGTWLGQKDVPMSKRAMDAFMRMANDPERYKWIV
jgi:hypothetical protein